MKRYALIFLAAIFLPSLVLGWLALRTAGEQRILIERQATDLHQVETDTVAAGVRAAMEEKQRTFAEMIHTLAATHSPAALAENYGPLIATIWPDGGVPFAINPAGTVAYPTTAQAGRNRRQSDFLQDNRAFLNNESAAEVYAPQQQQQITGAQVVQKSKVPLIAAELSKGVVMDKGMSDQLTQQSRRNVAPQKVAPAAPVMEPAVFDFKTAVAEGSQGLLARFVQNELQVLFWTRPDPKSNWIFGLMLGRKELDQLVKNSLPPISSGDSQLAILNEKARPVVTSPPGFTADWKRPFVATEIGEALPHWEVALYLTNPDQLADSAQLIRVTLILLIALALAAILAGGYFVAVDTRRQLALAQKKTDFVSNVSHELKTPLTSIRMFAELLADNRVKEPEKRSRYLRIIASESERLARLVNNVLDFARLEKKQRIYHMQECDLLPVIERIWEAESIRLQEAGFSTQWTAEPGPYTATCDADAISQILVNLMSNAEKYGGERREIELRTGQVDGALHLIVLDRGPGVPRGLEEKIFEAFYRADDSLASGIQGSGLGLTLAHSIAKDHGATLTCRSRIGGGSAFTLNLPLHSPTLP